MKENIVATYGAELSKLFVEAEQKTYSSDELSLSSVTERSLQKKVVVPLQQRILDCILPQTVEDDKLLQERISCLKSCSQHQFGIKPEHVSPTDWYSAVLELNLMHKCLIPCDKIGCIVAAARAIYNSCNFMRMKRGEHPGFISADDFLPIFIYVVCHSKLRSLQTTANFLFSLCDPEQLNGESGYYLTVFESSLQFIKSIDLASFTHEPLVTATVSAETPTLNWLQSIPLQTPAGKFVIGSKLQDHSHSTSSLDVFSE